MKPRIIVCGLGRTGYKVFRLLRQQGAFVVGIHHKPIPSEAAGDVIIGELHTAATLTAAGIQQAHTLVIASSDDARNLAIMLQARVLNPQIRIINRFYNTSLAERLDQTLSDHLSMSVVGLAAPVFTFAALGNKAIGQIKLFQKTWPIQEEYIDEYHPWLGRKLSDLWEERSRMLIYYLPVIMGRAIADADLLLACKRRDRFGSCRTLGTRIKSRRSHHCWYPTPCSFHP